MANCMATAIGSDKTRDKNTHRLGSDSAWAEAATWHTFAVAYVEKDGSGYVEVRRGSYSRGNAQEIHRFDFGPESEG